MTMGSDRSHWELVSDGDSSRADLTAANAKIVEMAREMGQLKTELELARTARAANAERVRTVVRDAALALLTERKLYIVKPHHPTMGEVALEAYGHGKACDAAALLGDDLQAVLSDIATRAAEQLVAVAAVGLSAKDRDALQMTRAEVVYQYERCAKLAARHSDRHPDWSAQRDEYERQIVVLDRLLASPPATDLHSAILALLDSDAPAGDLRKALAELVGRR